jgi:hypothetical protein
LVTHDSDGLLKYIKERLAFDEGESRAFFPQLRVYAAKPKWHLRRTLHLDPVASLFFYDLVFRSRALFRKPFSLERMHFGYRFENGKFMPVHDAHNQLTSLPTSTISTTTISLRSYIISALPMKTTRTSAASSGKLMPDDPWIASRKVSIPLK